MIRTIGLSVVLATTTLYFVSDANAADVKIVSWNAEAGMYEAIEKRHTDFGQLVSDLNPDVLVLIEVNGPEELKRIISGLGWTEYHAVLSDFSDVNTDAFSGLEVAVISKIPITAATELDASNADGTHAVFGTFGALPTTEEKLSSQGISHIQPLANTDRGTLRVDLANGLTIFPVHLKSNTNGPCIDADEASKTLAKMGLAIPAEISNGIANGFDLSTKENVLNAVKRERVIAAVEKQARAASSEGRMVVIAGDFNTSYEAGKVGSTFDDCNLANYGCAKMPFPANTCVAGDGYDDTLSILELGLTGGAPWKVLTKELGRTYDDDAFADKAIDHIAVPATISSKFAVATKSGETYGSDHFAVMTTYSDGN